MGNFFIWVIFQCCYFLNFVNFQILLIVDIDVFNNSFLQEVLLEFYDMLFLHSIFSLSLGCCNRLFTTHCTSHQSVSWFAEKQIGLLGFLLWTVITFASPFSCMVLRGASRTPQFESLSNLNKQFTSLKKININSSAGILRRNVMNLVML